eukprot:4053098-Pyramimonas_sp.AAC.1
MCLKQPADGSGPLHAPLLSTEHLALLSHDLREGATPLASAAPPVPQDTLVQYVLLGVSRRGRHF